MNECITGVQDLSGAGLIEFLVLLVRGLFWGGAYSGAGVNRVNTVIQYETEWPIVPLRN